MILRAARRSRRAGKRRAQGLANTLTATVSPEQRVAVRFVIVAAFDSRWHIVVLLASVVALMT